VQANSRPVTSNQLFCHPRLAALVTRHLQSPSRRPVAAYSRDAFAAVLEAHDGGHAIVLDSFCGTGHSTAALASRHPGQLVVGVDQSAHRLARRPAGSPDNQLLLRADCEDLWQLLLEYRIPVSHHYLFYPNPWPKAAQVQRRVHGSAGFPRLLALGGALELRSNWHIYVEEFGLAMHLAGRRGVVSQLQVEHPLTHFERKYRDSGHPLWCFRAGSGAAGVP
jgi:tRNA (guanine-N7-)-methyltransferase